MIGCACVHSRQIIAISATAETQPLIAQMMPESNHSSCSALIQHVLQQSDTEHDGGDAEIVGRLCPLLLASSTCGGSCTTRCVRNSEMMPMGILMKKIQCQL